MLSLVTSCKNTMMAADVPVQNIQPNWCLATQGTFAVKDQADYVRSCFHLLE